MHVVIAFTHTHTHTRSLTHSLALSITHSHTHARTHAHGRRRRRRKKRWRRKIRRRRKRRRGRRGGGGGGPRASGSKDLGTPEFSLHFAKAHVREGEEEAVFQCAGPRGGDAHVPIDKVMSSLVGPQVPTCAAARQPQHGNQLVHIVGLVPCIRAGDEDNIVGA
jgi:hypothetical protein